VTEQRRSEEALRAADRSKDEFLAVLSHELRNPIAPILTAVKLLQAKGPADPTLQRLGETILRQALQLSKLVDDLLDVGRVMNGKLRLEKGVTDLTAILKQAIEASLPAIERRHHVLHVALPESPVVVDVDAARIVQVVSNLLHNAAKYMKEGGRVELTAAAEEGRAVIRVRDEGVGIAPEMLDRIFDAFVQVDSSTHRAQGGLGIGLALVKALVDLHGGTVQARSEGIGKGSEFTVRLPVATFDG
jgi:signal transduction histidine kinase